MANTNFLRILHGLNHFIFIGFLVVDPNLYAIAIGYLLATTIGAIGISAGYHRYYSHRSYECSRLVQAFMLLCATFGTVGSALTWVGIHRLHHAKSDTPDDPHSPRFIGKLATLFHVWSRYDIPPRYIKSLLKDPLLKFQHKYYLYILAAIIVSIFALFGFEGVAYYYCLPAILTFYTTGLVNLLGHRKGEPTNNPWWVNLLLIGEGYHKNHHDNARRLRFGRFDPAYAFIKLVKNENIQA